MLDFKLHAPGLLVLATLYAMPVAAQSVGGKAFGSYVNAGGMTARSPVATLPATGGYAVGEAPTFGVPNSLDASWLTAVTTGDVSRSVSSSQSTSELENVSVLGGVITADVVTAIASSYVNASQAASDATGSGFTNLAVNGVPVTEEIAPNTRVDLPGVGYAVLNEQEPSGDGFTTSGITVNMIHVVLQQPVLDLLGQVIGYQTVGNIIVGSATSSVTR